MFRQRTSQFDRGMLMNTISVDRGLVTQLDPELAEASKQLLVKATSRLPRKNASVDALEEERERNYRRTAWNNDYISLLNITMKMSELYGAENQCLAPGNLIMMESSIQVPSMSESLEEVRLQMRKFMDTLKVESKLKKKPS